MKNLWIVAFFALTTACDKDKPALPPTSDLGTGLNSVEHRYARPASDVLHSAAAAIQALGLHSDSQKSDALGGEIIARRATDDKVAITVKSIDESTASASVRVGPGNRNMANLIHEKIAAGLGLQESAEEGESVGGTYSFDLKVCMGAAEKALRVLKYELVDRKTFDGGAHLRGRGEDSLPVSFKLSSKDEGHTAVTIVCGTSKGVSNRERCDQLKAEFEKAAAAARTP